MTEEMKAYTLEQEARKVALIALADMVAQGSAVMGLEFDITCRRAMEYVNKIQAENIPAANEEYEKMLELEEGKPFQYEGFKITKNTPAKKYSYIGERGKEIERFVKQKAKIDKEIKGRQKLAKETGVGLKVEEPELKEGQPLYKMTQVAPNKKPAA